MMKIWPVSLVVALLLTAPALFAEEPVDNEEIDVDMELLEFLADWEGEQGQWIDPVSFAQTQEGMIEVSNDE